MVREMLTVIVLCHEDRQARLLERLEKNAFSGADLVCVVFSDVETTPNLSFPFIGIKATKAFTGFNAGYNRDLALTSVLSKITTSVVFMDGDCVPSLGLMEHHRKVLHASEDPIVTFGSRREPGRQDVRESVFMHKEKEFAPTLHAGMDVECRDLESIRNHRTVWSCNCGANVAALHRLRRDGRMFHPMFDGYWGGEDTGVAIAAYYSKCGLIGLDPQQSYVQHVTHDHRMVTRKNLDRIPEFEALMRLRCTASETTSGDSDDQPTTTI
jgi:hypothetical protein